MYIREDPEKFCGVAWDGHQCNKMQIDFFFSVKLLVFFSPFLDAHCRALEGKATAISTALSFSSLLMHGVLLLFY